mgnify:CR=1 FL=1
MLQLAALAGCSQSRPAVKPTPPPVVRVSTPIERQVTDYEVFTARTQADQSVDINPRVTGYLTKILFKDGDEVKTGDVLFEIDDRSYKASLDQAKAGLKVAQADLTKSQAEYDIGLSVQKQNKGAMSEQEIARRLGARDEAAASVEKAQADIELAQLYYDWCKVRTPIDGRVSRHLVDVGNLVTENVTTLTNVVSISPIWAYFNVDQNTAEHYQRLVTEGKIKSPRASEIPVEMAIGANADFSIDGAIDFVSNQLDASTGSIQLRAVFKNENGKLVSGLFTRVRVPASPPHSALLVTDAAVGTNQGQRYVLVVNDQQEVEYRIVDVGQMHNGLREVKPYRTITDTGPDGKDVTKQVEVLKPTDRVIVEGLLRARPGIKVDPQKVDMLTLLRSPESPLDKTTAQKSEK